MNAAIFNASGDVKLYHNAIETAHTVVSESGGFEVLTGSPASFQRVLTTKDLFTKYKADQTNRSFGSPLTDDPDLSGWNLKADTWYSVEGLLDFRSVSATPSAKFLWEFSETSQIQTSSVMKVDNNGLITGDFAGMTSNTQVLIPANGLNGVKIVGKVLTHATLPVVMDLKWAQNTQDATVTTLQSGSWFRVVELGPDP